MLKHRSSFKRMLFFTDLDGTMIRSHRHQTDAPCVWVEELHGHPQSYMTEHAYAFFRMQKQFDIVPLTTRNHAQYARLHESLTALGMHSALICNGAVLLQDGQEDAAWSAESAAISAPALPHLLQLKKLAEQSAGSECVIASEPFFFYVRGADTQKLYDLLLNSADTGQIAVYRDSRKVYCIPQILSKETAAKRFLQRSGYRRFIAAGDSVFDLSLLNAADFAIFPDTLADQVHAKGTYFACPEPFPDAVCSILEQIRIEEI